MKKIWLIRHGESVANAGAATQDHETIPLNITGLEQAERISLVLPEPPDLIITSPFTRTQQTAEPTLSRFPGAGHEVWQVQEFTYLSPTTCINTTAAERRGRVDEYWQRLDPNYVDGEGAESFSQFIARAKAAIDRLSLLPGWFIVMFTHAQFIRAMRLLKAEPEQDVTHIMNRFRELPRIGNCEITKWENSDNGNNGF
jgi:broad specificity phosphatase PhoE